MSLPEHILQAVREDTLVTDPFSTQRISRQNPIPPKLGAKNRQNNTQTKSEQKQVQQLVINGAAKQVGANRRVLSPAAMKKLGRINPKNFNGSQFTGLDSTSAKRPARNSLLAARSKYVFSLLTLLLCASAVLGAIAAPDRFGLLRQESNAIIEQTFANIVANVSASKNPKVQSSGLPGPIVFTPPSDGLEKERLTQANLIKFISGMIVVFRPNNNDAGEISRHIVEISKEYNLDPLLVASLISSESGFRSSARSSVGAMGLMQLRPSTANEVLVKMTSKGNKRKIRKYLNNPEVNIRLGIQYFLQLEKRYKGDRYLALAAYNWGPGNVRKARKAGKSFPGSVKHYAESILERTTRWNQHFRNAQIAASKLAVQSASNIKQPPVMSATLGAKQTI